MGFDIKAAREAGYDDEEIIEHLKTTAKDFDFDKAVKSGYSPAEILDHYSTKKPITKTEIRPVGQEETEPTSTMPVSKEAPAVLFDWKKKEETVRPTPIGKRVGEFIKPLNPLEDVATLVPGIRNLPGVRPYLADESGDQDKTASAMNLLTMFTPGPARLGKVAGMAPAAIKEAGMVIPRLGFVSRMEEAAKALKPVAPTLGSPIFEAGAAAGRGIKSAVGAVKGLFKGAPSKAIKPVVKEVAEDVEGAALKEEGGLIPQVAEEGGEYEIKKAAKEVEKLPDVVNSTKDLEGFYNLEKTLLEPEKKTFKSLDDLYERTLDEFGAETPEEMIEAARISFPEEFNRLSGKEVAVGEAAKKAETAFARKTAAIDKEITSLSKELAKKTPGIDKKYIREKAEQIWADESMDWEQKRQAWETGQMIKTEGGDILSDIVNLGGGIRPNMTYKEFKEAKALPEEWKRIPQWIKQFINSRNKKAITRQMTQSEWES